MVVVNGDWASCKGRAEIAQKSIKSKSHICVMDRTSLLVYYRDLTSGFNDTEIVIFKIFHIVVHFLIKNCLTIQLIVMALKLP